ncbi:hypothetical protein DH2020_013618 [Rehmannia glutinosa]|uniref:Uncharacterized protein n=1 Tax=Rehmannia glutinosa TaxID=99300 RepID=A0ABR0X640_REHGL
MRIDHQAAESLGKNEKPPSDDQLVNESSPRTPETKPLIKDQLKKKSPEKLVNQNWGSLNINSKSNTSRGLTDSDWTELLSVPDKKGASGGVSVSRSSNQVSGIRALKKDGKKVVGSGPGMNVSVVDGRSKKVRNNGVSKSFESSVDVENSTSVDSDDKASSVGDATPRTSSAQSPSSGGEYDQRNGGSTLVIGNTHLANTGRVKGVNDTVNGEKLHPSDDSDNFSRKMSISHEKELDMKVGLNDGERLKRNLVQAIYRHWVLGLPILAERAAAKAIEAIKERENLVARLEGRNKVWRKYLKSEPNSKYKRTSRYGYNSKLLMFFQASELQTTMMETMEASANADLTRSLASVQKNLEVELRAPKGVEFELEMLEAEYSFINDKVGRMQDQAKTLETSIETTRREIENPTEVEIELKRRLHQLTDHLIQKQAQVETLSSEKAMLLLRIEAVSRLLDEYEPMIDSADFPAPHQEMTLNQAYGNFQIRNSGLYLKENAIRPATFGIIGSTVGLTLLCRCYVSSKKFNS